MKKLQTADEDLPTFEETYPRHEFAPLVTIALALGGWLAGLQRERAKREPRARVQTSKASGPAAPAT